MDTIEQIRDSQLVHERLDTERFSKIDERLDALPNEIKLSINGSVETTLNKQMGGFFRWLGVGGFILLATIGVAWGAVITKVDRHEVELQSTLDVKDLKNVELQLSAQAASIQGIRDDVSFIRKNVLGR